MGRWGDDGPPDEAYSRVTDAERYAPLHGIADTLVAGLVADFAVTVDDDRARALARTDHPDAPDPDWLVRAATLVPDDPAAAPLSVLWTSFPGLHLVAGRTVTNAFPRCGCDACDEEIPWVVEELEAFLRRVTGGTFTESWDGTWLASNGSTHRVNDEHATRLGRPWSQVWAPWPRR